MFFYQRLPLIRMLPVALCLIIALSGSSARKQPNRLKTAHARRLSVTDSLWQLRIKRERLQIAKAKRLYRTGKTAQAYRLLYRTRQSTIFDAEARLFLGKCFLQAQGRNKPNVRQAIRYLSSALRNRKTQAEAAYTLGRLYVYGFSELTPDFSKGLAFLTQADAGKEVRATCLLGELYFQGTAGIEKNEATGISYLDKAATSGSSDAQWLLATIYTQGTPTLPKDLKKAKFWYALVVQARRTQLNSTL